MTWLKTISLILLYLILPSIVLADGMMFMDAEAVKAAKEKMQHMLINEPEQKAVIFFDKGEEQLIISPSYDGAPEKFAWVVPVPTKPKVEIGDARIFEELAKMASSYVITKSIPDRNETKKPEVKVIERKIVGDYDVSVLASDDGSVLMDWLSENGYHVPKQALKTIQDYVKRRWTFVACKVVDTGKETADKLKNGILAPLKLTFRSARPIYPLKLSSANPEPFDLLVYLIMPVKWKYIQSIRPEAAPVGCYKPMDYAWDYMYFDRDDNYYKNKFPAIAQLSNYSMRIWIAAIAEETGRVKPEQCKQDLFWNVFEYPVKKYDVEEWRSSLPPPYLFGHWRWGK